MSRTRKATILVVATLCVAGCAHSDRSTSRYGEPMWRPVADAKAVKATEAPPVAILPQTHFAAAKLFESQGLYGKAITQYRKAVAVDHTFVEAYHRLGLLLSAVGKHEEALKPLQRAVQLRANNAMLRNNYGFELLLNQRWTDAEEQLTRAVRLQPEFPRAHVNLGIVQSKLGRFDEALASFRRVLPEPDAYYNVGLMYRGQHRYAEAAEVFEYVLTLDPNFVAARTQLKQIASHIEPVAVPPWDRKPSKKVTTTADRAGQSQPHPRDSRSTTPVPETRRNQSPAGVKHQNNKRSRAEPQKPLDSAITLLDEALQQLENSATAKSRGQASTQRPVHAHRPHKPDASAEQVDIDTLLSIFENELNCLEETESQSTTFADHIEHSPHRDDSTAASRPTTTATPTTRPREITRKERQDRTPSQRFAERKDKPRKPQSVKRRMAPRDDTDRKPRIIFTKRTPTLAPSKGQTQAYHQDSNQVIDSFVVEQSMSSADPPRLFSTVHPADSFRAASAAVDDADPALTGCIDSRALIRQLEDQLAVVRNEINCLETRKAELDSIFSSRESGLPIDTALFSTDSDFAVTPFFSSGEMEDLDGPPLELAQEQGKKSTTTRRAQPRPRMASTIIDERPKRSRNRDGIKHRQQSDTPANRASTPQSDTKPRRKGLKSKKPTEPSARLQGWRVRFETLQDLLEITQNELACQEERAEGHGETATRANPDTISDSVSRARFAPRRRTQSAWATMLRDTDGGSDYGRTTAQASRDNTTTNP